MPRIAWSEKMSIGVDPVDRQHRHLLDLFNRLEESLAAGDAPLRVRGLFHDLAGYTRYHFSSEANQMRLDGLADLHGHLAAHDEFTAKVASLEPLLIREGDEAAALEASRFLRRWILRHIVVVDRLTFAARRTPDPTREPADAAAEVAPASGSAEPVAAGAVAENSPAADGPLQVPPDVASQAAKALPVLEPRSEPAPGR